MSEDQWKPVTHENCKHVVGPFYHGTKAYLAIGALLSTGYPSNYEEGRVLKHLYFSANLEPAIWGAELAMSFAGVEGRGHIYIVEPTETFEDDPNLTNKRFPGNPTKSYRTRDPLRIVGVIEDWHGHSVDSVREMMDSLLELRCRGDMLIED
jgi:rifampin ADP-ribosylating transferase